VRFTSQNNTNKKPLAIFLARLYQRYVRGKAVPDLIKNQALIYVAIKAAGGKIKIKAQYWREAMKSDAAIEVWRDPFTGDFELKAIEPEKKGPKLKLEIYLEERKNKY